MTDEIFKQQYEGWVSERDKIAIEIKECNDINRLIYKNIDLIIDFCNRIPELYIKADLDNCIRTVGLRRKNRKFENF